MFATPDTPAEAAAQNFIDITEMYRMKFLNNDSTVWMNADAPEAGIWVLTHGKSTYVKVYRTVYAGWVRLTRSTAKWGRTAQATTQNPVPVMDIRNIPDGSKPNATILVVHREKGQPVGVVADGSIQHFDRSGSVTFDPFTVIDLNKYTAPTDAKTSSPWEAAHAMINGAAIMSCTSSEELGEFIRENMDTFRVDFGEKHLNFLEQHHQKIEEYAKLQTGLLVKKIAELDSSGAWQRETAGL